MASHLKARNWLTRKDIGHRPLCKRGPRDDYPHKERAMKSYALWLSGYVDEEIALYQHITPEDVKLDVQHVHLGMSTREIIAHGNDRSRILLQRAESDNYRGMIKEALGKKVDEYLKAGISPVGVMREFREAVGMTEKPGGIGIQVTQVQVSGGNQSGIHSSEDVLRRVQAQLAKEASPDAPIIDVESEDPNDDSLGEDLAEEDGEPEVTEAEQIPDVES